MSFLFLDLCCPNTTASRICVALPHCRVALLPCVSVHVCGAGAAFRVHPIMTPPNPPSPNPPEALLDCLIVL